MDLQGTYPRNFISFIRNLEIDPDNLVVENILDRESDFISQYYTPNNRVSELGRKVLESLNRQRVRTHPGTLDKGSLGYLILRSDFLTHYKNIETLLKIILLESFSIEIAIFHDESFRKYLSKEDIKDTRETLKFVLDIISLDPRYSEIISHLQDLNVSLGYIEAQVPVIINDSNGGVISG